MYTVNPIKYIYLSKKNQWKRSSRSRWANKTMKVIDKLHEISNLEKSTILYF